MSNIRKYFLDWLRVLVVLLIIPHHVALTYSHIGKGYVYTSIKVDSLYYFIQSDFLNLWFMILLFFISGVSAFYSISKRSIKGFIKERVKKLLIPVLFYTYLLGPLTAFYAQTNLFSLNLSFLEFYPLYLKNIQEYLGWAQMWFCAYLFTYSIITIPFFIYMLNRQKIIDKVSNFLLKKYNLFIPMLLIVATEALLRPIYPGYQNLINDWANFCVYLAFFVLGFFVAGKSALFDKIQSLFSPFMILSLLSTISYIVINYYNFSLMGIEKIILSILKGVAEYSWVMVFIAVSKRFLSFNNKWLMELSKSSFGLYIFHFAFITIFNIALIPIDINHYFKFIISIVLTYAAYYIFYKLCILRIEPLRKLCSLS